MKTEFHITKSEFKKIAAEGGSFRPNIDGNHDGRYECKFENGTMVVSEDYDLLVTIRYKSIADAWDGWKEFLADFAAERADAREDLCSALKELAWEKAQETIKSLRRLSVEDFDFDVHDMVGAMLVYKEILRDNFDEAHSIMSDEIGWGGREKVDESIKSMLRELTENW